MCQLGYCAAVRTCNDALDCLAQEECTQGRCALPGTTPTTDAAPPEWPVVETPPTPDTAAPDVPSKGSCRQDADCSSQERCQSGRCIPRSTETKCTQDTQCPNKQSCQSGQCVPCQDQCQPSETQCSGNKVVSCVLERGCGRWSTAGQACKAGTSCKAGKCVAGCSSDAECTNGKVCANGQCTTWCFGDSECSAGYKCIQQKCAVSCTTNDQCRLQQGYTCESGQCRKTFTVCRTDSECPGGFRCNSAAGRCYQSCQSLDQCQGYHVCASKRCVPSTACRQHTDCPSGFRCDGSTGRCRTRCSSNNHCQTSFECNTTTKQCGAKTCRSYRDCPSELACIQGSCKAACKQDTDCRPEYQCVSGVCKEGCTTDANCNGFKCDTTFTQSCYSSCHSYKDCKAGLACHSRRCVPGCKEDKDCPTGQLCESRMCASISTTPAKRGERCSRTKPCEQGDTCLSIGGNDYKVCMKKCSSYTSCSRYSSSYTCAYGVGATSGDKGCFTKCYSTSDCTSKGLYGYTCSYSTKRCIKSYTPANGNGKIYSSCEKSEDCEAGLVCINVDRVPSYKDFKCLPRCSARDTCQQDYSCRTHNGLRIWLKTLGHNGHRRRPKA